MPKISVKERKVKNAAGKKCPLKTVALAVKPVTKSMAKVRQPKVARVELKAGGGLDGSEKPG